MPGSPERPTLRNLDGLEPAELRSVFDGVDEIGVDTEFRREDTYFAEFCLLQAAVDSEVFVLDPLSGAGLADAWQFLLAHHWVLHSGRQDLEVVIQVAGALPTGIFDTQIAAALCGYAPQLGYANLVRELLGITLAKTQTRADWRRRPLPQAMLSYAADDVRYLHDAADRLRERLTRLDRLDWAQEDSRALLDRELYAVDPTTAVERLKGAGKLEGQARAAARGLATWRENRALASNRPRQWIMKNAVLIEIARRCPQSVHELGSIEGIPAGVLRRAGDEIVALVRAARHSIDDYRPPAPLTESEKAALKEMQAQVTTAAAALGIQPEILAPRRELVAALRGSHEGRLFSGWRRTVVGESLAHIVQETVNPA